MRFALAAGLFVALLGCGSRQSGSPGSSAAPPPEAKAYEGYRAGLFSLQAAQSSLAEALGASQKLHAGLPQGSEVEAGLQDIVFDVDSAGNTIADHVADPPTQAEFNTDFSRHDDARLKAIEAINDALHDLREASGISRDMAGRISGMQSALEELADLMDVAEQDLLSALRSLGGNDEGIPKT